MKIKYERHRRGEVSDWVQAVTESQTNWESIVCKRGKGVANDGVVQI